MGAIPLRQEPTTSFDSLWTAQGGGLRGGGGGGGERERERDGGTAQRPQLFTTPFSPECAEEDDGAVEAEFFCHSLPRSAKKTHTHLGARASGIGRLTGRQLHDGPAATLVLIA